MPDLGLILRLDASGLGSQTRLICELLDPAVVVAVDMERNSRGPTVSVQHPNLLTVPFRGGADQGGTQRVASHLQSCSAVYTAESLYWQGLPRRLPKTRFCIAANPELWRPLHDERRVAPAWPTAWLAEGHPQHPVVPHPSPYGTGRFPDLAASNVARSGPARRVLHIAAPAMLDRNGTDPLIRALSAYTGPPFTLLLAGAGLGRGRRSMRSPVLSTPDLSAMPVKIGSVRLQRVPEVVDRADLFDGVDLLVIPRRYAGLCLPAQEAASAGVPVLMPDLSPQDAWPGVDSSIACGRGTVEAMRGGKFRVAAPEPESIAGRLAAYTSDPETRQAWQQRALAWAQATSWPKVQHLWEQWLAG